MQAVLVIAALVACLTLGHVLRANPDRRDRRGPLVKEGHLDQLAHKGRLDHKGQQGRGA